MDEEDEGVLIDAHLKMLCEKHNAPFENKHHNEQATVFLLMRALNDHLFPEGNEMGSAQEIADRFQRVVGTGKAVCCIVGEAVMARILARVPASTGDKIADEEIALALEPTAGRHHRYPKVRQCCEVVEGGKRYFLTLGPLEDVPLEMRVHGHEESLLAIISDGHPNVGDGTGTVLDLERVSDEREARDWFEQALRTKSWLPKQ